MKGRDQLQHSETTCARERQPEATTKLYSGEALVPEALIQDPRRTAIRGLQLLWHRRRFLGMAVIAGLLFGTLVAFLLPKTFESTTQLMPPDSQSTSSMALFAGLTARSGNSLGAAAGDFLGIKSSGALFIGILRSRTVEDRLVDRFQLQRVYRVPLEEDARRALAQNTSMSEDRKSGIITIVVADRDPKRAAALAHAYVEELDRLVMQLSTSSARREREFLEDRLKTVQTDLEAAEKELGQFASKNRAIDIKEQGKALVDAIAKVEGQLIAAKADLEGLKQIYSDNSVRVRAARARINELHNQLEKMGGKGENIFSDTGDSADSFYPSIRKLPMLGVTYADFYRRTKVEESVYETLTQQFELAKVQEAKETPSVKVLDPASIPARKSFPPRLLIMFLCTFMAFAAATVLTLWKARWDELDARDPRRAFVLEVVHTVTAHMPWTSSSGSSPRANVRSGGMDLLPGSDSFDGES